MEVVVALVIIALILYLIYLLIVYIIIPGAGIGLIVSAVVGVLAGLATAGENYIDAMKDSFSFNKKAKSILLEVDPKTGDWLCHKCSTINKSNSIYCKDCGEYKPTPHLDKKIIRYGGGWICGKCETANSRYLIYCNKCGASKKFAKPSPASGSAGTWNCKKCGVENTASSRCKNCGVYYQPASATTSGTNGKDWTCKNCSTVNKSNAIYCKDCGTYK